MDDDWGDWAAPEQAVAAAAAPEPPQQAATLHNGPAARQALDQSLFSALDAGEDEFGGFAAAPAPLPAQRTDQQHHAAQQQGGQPALAKGDPAWLLDGRSNGWVEARVRRPSCSIVLHKPLAQWHTVTSANLCAPSPARTCLRTAGSSASALLPIPCHCGMRPQPSWPRPSPCLLRLCPSTTPSTLLAMALSCRMAATGKQRHTGCCHGDPGQRRQLPPPQPTGITPPPPGQPLLPAHLNSWWVAAQPRQWQRQGQAHCQQSSGCKRQLLLQPRQQQREMMRTRILGTGPLLVFRQRLQRLLQH